MEEFKQKMENAPASAAAGSIRPQPEGAAPLRAAERPTVEPERSPGDDGRKKRARRTGSRMSFILILIIILEVGLTLLGRLFVPEENTALGYLWSFMATYGVAIPLGLLLLRLLPADRRQINRLTGKQFLTLLLMSVALMYIGSIIGSILSLVLSFGQAENPVQVLTAEGQWTTILFGVFIGPFLEEVLFRKALIDRTARFGEKAAILFSALVFGLFHMNLYQFFYAFGLGLLFGYVYLSTGKLSYTVGLHMIINFQGMVIAPWVLEQVTASPLTEALEAGTVDPEMVLEAAEAAGGQLLTPGYFLACLYSPLLIGLTVWGFVLLLKYRNRLVFRPAAEELQKGDRKALYLNAGFILFFVICLMAMVLFLFGFLGGAS